MRVLVNVIGSDDWKSMRVLEAVPAEGCPSFRTGKSVRVQYAYDD